MERCCTKCGVTKPISDFGRHKKMRDGYNTVCKACCIEKQRRRLATPEGRAQQRQSEKVSRKKNEKYKLTLLRRLLRLLNAENDGNSIIITNIGYTIAEWEALCDWFENVCLCCGHEGRLTADHVIPVALGGLDHITNLQPLCASCNRRKGVAIEDYRDPGRLTAFLKWLYS